MDTYSIVKKRFIEPFAQKSTGNIGTELEFPLLNMSKEPVDTETADGLLFYFLENGFTAEETTADGTPAFIRNSFGDYLSFDNSYNNFEFSMNYGDDLWEIANRFYGYFAKAQQYLKKNNYLLTGMGTNPYKKYITQSHVDYPVYNMVDEYLHRFPARHTFPDFPAYLSSVQTHLDVPLAQLPNVLTLFARLDFIRALLFSNSPSWEWDGTLCYRDFLWENSAFPNTGKVDGKYENTDDIIKDFQHRKIFNRIRKGKYETFEPVSLNEYFEKSDAEENDIMQFLSFKNVEITARGTLEIRGDCAQPLCDAFAPPAFSLGILFNAEKAVDLLDGIFEEYKTSDLRNRIIGGADLNVPDNLVLSFVGLADEGLKSRGKGEEKLLAPLFERAHRSICPAKSTLSRLKKGEPVENILSDYSLTSD